ncbi:MAG: SRPBCC domain-containing protein [Microthrixaceae bacterium]
MSLDERRLDFRRVHRAPVALVFECLTTPSHLAAFWGPEGCTTPEDSIVVDLRPGGAFHADMVFGGGAHVAPMRAVYDLVEPPSRLGWTEPENGMRTEVQLAELDDGTTEVITTLIDPPPGFESPDARRGFETSLDRMVAYTAEVGSTSR